MKHLPRLDGVRGLAILSVFFLHVLHISFFSGVDLFFVLSGFLITNVLLEGKRKDRSRLFRNFYERRAKRILPSYFLTLLVASMFAGWSWLRHWYLYVFLANLIIPLHISYPAIFPPLWSLAVEEQFYLLWPIAVYFLSTRHLKHVSLMILVCAPLFRGVFQFSDQWPIYMLTPFRMDLIAAGALLGLIWRDKPQLISKYGSALGIVFILAGLSGLVILGNFHLALYTNSRLSNVTVYEASLIECVGIMLLALGDRGAGWMAFSPLRFIGKISYTMYLVHVGIIFLLGPRLHGLPLAAVALAITVAYASASWFLMERHLLHHKPVPAAA